MPTGDAYSSGHLVLSLLGLAFVLLVETSDILNRIDIILDCDIITGLNIITESDISPNIDFHGASATGVAFQQGTLTPPDTWSLPFGTCKCSTCWDQSLSELVVIFPDYALRISLGTFSILLCRNLSIKIRNNKDIPGIKINYKTEIKGMQIIKLYLLRMKILHVSHLMNYNVFTILQKLRLI